MVFDHIEKVKQEYTDKYVVVDGDRPELARFKDEVGIVKTVNMSGRALVEFTDYHLNIGWYDIDLDYLKVVDKPPPKEKKAPAKPAAKPADKPAAKQPATDTSGKKLSPLELARMQGAAKKDPETAEKPAPAEPQAEKPASPPAGGKTSTADILAMARGKKAAPASESKIEEPAADDPPGQVTEESMAVEEETAPAEAPTAEPAPAEEPAATSQIDRSSMSVDDVIAWCREHDAN